MKVLITGARGQVGREVSRVFEANGNHDVLSCSRNEIDVASRDSVFCAITSFQPDVVVHCAAYTAVDAAETDPDNAYLVNALGTRHVVGAADVVGARVIVPSTDYVFDGTKRSPYREWDETNPLNVYGHTKLASEKECRPADAIIRTSWVFGRYGHNIVKTLIELAAKSDEVTFVNDQVGKPTCAEDLAAATYQVAVNRLSGVFHVTNEGETTWFDLAREVFEAAGADPQRVLGKETDQIEPKRPAIRPRYSVLDTLAWKASGMNPLTDHREALHRVVKELMG